MTSDKRDIITTFQARFAGLVERFPGSQAKYAAAVGIDRSALSQLLSHSSSRLPRAETLCRIAEVSGVTLDWLLGLSQTSTAGPTEIAATAEIEEIGIEGEETALARWHRDAIGSKIRYVPAFIPDFLRTRALIAFERGRGRGPLPATQIREAEIRIDYNRRPETDMEACMPLQTLQALARGEGLWAGFSAEDRRHQLTHMAALASDLYPSFRLFLHDVRLVFAAPYTIFGQQRAAVYMGDMYLVLTGTDHIRRLTRHFDDLIRKVEVHPHEIPDWIEALCRNVD